MLTCIISFGEVPTGEAKDSQRRRYLVCDDIARIRELRRGTQDLPRPLQRGEHFPTLRKQLQIIEQQY
jgi:hypothetical protein